MGMKRILPVEDSTTGTLPVSVRLPPRWRAEAKRRAKEEGVGLSEYFRALLIADAEANPKKAKRRPEGRRS